MNWIKRLFVNDWRFVERHSGNWSVHSDFGDFKEKCHFTIMYSPIRNRYKIKTSGYHPKQHSLYKGYLQERLHELNNNIHNP